MKLSFSQKENLVIAIAWMVVYASIPLYMYYGFLAINQTFMWHEVWVMWSYIPAKKASSLDPIEAIRYE